MRARPRGAEPRQERTYVPTGTHECGERLVVRTQFVNTESERVSQDRFGCLQHHRAGRRCSRRSAMQIFLKTLTGILQLCKAVAHMFKNDM